MAQTESKKHCTTPCTCPLLVRREKAKLRIERAKLGHAKVAFKIGKVEYKTLIRELSTKQQKLEAHRQDYEDEIKMLKHELKRSKQREGEARNFAKKLAIAAKMNRMKERGRTVSHDLASGPTSSESPNVNVNDKDGRAVTGLGAQANSDLTDEVTMNTTPQLTTDASERLSPPKPTTTPSKTPPVKKTIFQPFPTNPRTPTNTTALTPATVTQQSAASPSPLINEPDLPAIEESTPRTRSSSRRHDQEAENQHVDVAGRAEQEGGD